MLGKILSGALLLALIAGPAQAQTAVANVTIDTSKPGVEIDRHIYGQFAEHLGRGIYEGIWVGEASPIPNIRGYRKDVVEALKKIHVPNVRWPGGCFGDLYDWHDGIGPRAKRPVRVNVHWGGVTEDNSFGTHEFMNFAELIGAEAYVSLNVGSLTPYDSAQWLEYMTSDSRSSLANERRKNGRAKPWKVQFIGIGNETWGCGGNMTAEYYADVYRQYVSVLKPYGTLIASDSNSDDYEWTEKLLQRALYRHPPDVPTTLAYISKQPQINMISVHFYTFSGNDWGKKSPAVGFTEQDWARSMERTWKTDEMIARHTAILERHDPKGQVGISFSEWGAWWATDKNRPSNLYQENTLRDAVIAGLTLNIFHNHAARVRMANLAQMLNVLQSLILTDGEKMLLTPTYHVFDLYQAHQGATLLPTRVSAPDYALDAVKVPSLSVSASRNAQGEITLSLVNIDPVRAARVEIDLQGRELRGASGRVLTSTAMDAHPQFGKADPLEPVALEVPRVRKGLLSVTAPAKSVIALKLR